MKPTHTHSTIEAPASSDRIITPVAPTPRLQTTALRGPAYAPPRRRFPGVIAACVLGAAIGALAVSSYYDDRTIGERLDASVQTAQQTVASGSAQVGERAATVITDAGITAAVKTALAADPSLSALKIDVDTRDGVVALEGPAPDVRARERAEVLAAAPQGVVRVDNRLVVVAPTQ